MIWDFIQNQLLGMKWLNDLIGKLFQVFGLYLSSKLWSSVQFFIYDTLTGICNSPRLNVVDVTICERENNPDVPKYWYVLEQANIDGIVIWQNQKGEVYQTQPCREIKMIANSIVEYITMKQH